MTAAGSFGSTCIELGQRRTLVSAHTHTHTPKCTPMCREEWLHQDNEIHQTVVITMATHTCAHTDTHTHTCTCTCITTARVGYVAPIQGVSQQKATRQVSPLAAGTPASSSQLHGPLSAVGVLMYGLTRPMR